MTDTFLEELIMIEIFFASEHIASGPLKENKKRNQKPKRRKKIFSVNRTPSTYKKR